MIVPELILKGIFAQLPGVSLNDEIGERTPNFGFGDRHELVKYLLKTGDGSYPLVWLLSVPPLTDEEHTDGGHLCLKQCEIIIATRETRQALTASERYLVSFKYVLAPLCEYVVQGLESSSTTRIEGDEKRVGRYTDYSYEESGLPGASQDENAALIIDKWDAIRLSVKVEFNTNCQNSIKWKTVKIT